ncbi:methionyl-tRNA formyltransferase, mitochondrial-like isoform X2 [Ptychodera flava]
MKWCSTLKGLNGGLYQKIRDVYSAFVCNHTCPSLRSCPRGECVKGRICWNSDLYCLDNRRTHFFLRTQKVSCIEKRHFHSGIQCQCNKLNTSVNKQSCNEIRTSPPWRIMFFGTDDFAVESLKALNNNRIHGSSVSALRVVCSKSKGLRRGKHLDIIAPVQRYATDHNLPVSPWTDIDWSSGYDVGVVVSFGHLIPARVINRFPYGILNIHPSLLPRWRGASPIYHTILNGDKETGVTIIQISTKFDVGPIVAQQRLSVPDRCTTPQLSSLLSVKGADMLLEVLQNLPERIAQAKPQERKGATLARKITTSMSWIDWHSHSCEDVDRLYRAISYHVTLRTEWQGKLVKLYKMADPEITQGLYIPVSDPQPGQIVFHKKSKLLCVRSKDGWIAFEGVTLQMRKKMSAQDFYNGFLSRQKSSQRHSFCSACNNKTQSLLKTRS